MSGKTLTGPVIAAIGLVIAAIGLLVTLVLGHNYGACHSILGQFGQALSPQTQRQCEVAAGAHWIGLTGAIGGGVIFVIGLTLASAQAGGSGRRLPVRKSEWPPCVGCGHYYWEHQEGCCPTTARDPGEAAPPRQATRESGRYEPDRPLPPRPLPGLPNLDEPQVDASTPEPESDGSNRQAPDHKARSGRAVLIAVACLATGALGFAVGYGSGHRTVIHKVVVNKVTGRGHSGVPCTELSNGTLDAFPSGAVTGVNTTCAVTIVPPAYKSEWQAIAPDGETQTFAVVPPQYVSNCQYLWIKIF